MKETIGKVDEMIMLIKYSQKKETILGQICTFKKKIFSFFCVFRANSVMGAHCAPPQRQIGLMSERFVSLKNAAI